ncbi:hypothetical protein UlMin_003841 [Ulmus minor]
MSSSFTHKPYKTMPSYLDSSRTQILPTHLPQRHHIISSISDRISGLTFLSRPPNNEKLIQTRRIIVEDGEENEKKNETWEKMREEARAEAEREPALFGYYFTSILSHDSLESALANQLSESAFGKAKQLLVLSENNDVVEAVNEDLKAIKSRDPACTSHVHCFLNFKGFLACQAYRIAHKLWLQDRKSMALLIQNRVSEVFAVDIHPGAKIGRGILFDHATGLVVGETAVIGDNVTIFHNVTLGGTGKESGDRHPKIGDGVTIGAGTNVLGNIRVGEGAKIGAGSVVLKEVLPRSTCVGNPARLVGAGK